jgi:hypothetical protein
MGWKHPAAMIISVMQAKSKITKESFEGRTEV